MCYVLLSHMSETPFKTVKHLLCLCQLPYNYLTLRLGSQFNVTAIILNAVHKSPARACLCRGIALPVRFSTKLESLQQFRHGK